MITITAVISVIIIIIISIISVLPVPLLRLPDLDADPAHAELRGRAHAAPGQDGVHARPHALPQRGARPLDPEHHQLPDVPVQGDQEGIRLVTRHLLLAGKGTH